MSPPPKRNLTLDLNSGPSNSKRAKVSDMLTSPDVQMLKLTSPQLAEFLTRNPTLATPTPSGGYLFPTNVTEEQKLYVKGFEEAYEALKRNKNNTVPETVVVTTAGEMFAHRTQAQPPILVTLTAPPPVLPGGILPVTSNILLPTTIVTTNSNCPSTISEVSTNSRPSSSASGSYDSSADYVNGISIKEEPEDEISSPYNTTKKSRGSRKGTRFPQPIDMEGQEKAKLERKRLRNRLAATKCRKRKLEKIATLDVKVKDLKSENTDLAAYVKKLKESVCNLKQEVMEHMQNGCQIPVHGDLNA